VLIRVRVKPGARRAGVGGRYHTDDGHSDALLVSVTERAVEGRANEAVETVLAQALAVRRREVRLISGQRARTKMVDIPDRCGPLVDELLALPGPR